MTPDKRVEEELGRWLQDEAVLTKVKMTQLLTQYHQDLMSEVVGLEKLESILGDYCISGMPVLDQKVMMGYIRASLAESEELEICEACGEKHINPTN